MIAGVAPSRRHNQIQEFVLYSGSADDIFYQVIEFAKIYIEEISSVDVPRDTILYLNVILFGLIGLEDAVPHIEQIAKVSIHIQRVACVVYAVVGRREDEFSKETKTRILHEVFTNVNKSAPRAVNKHDGEQHDGRNACQDTNGRPDKIGVWAFQEEMSIRNRQVHLLRRVVRGVEAPEQSHLMGEVMIDEMCKLPDDVSIDEPVPGKGNRKQRVRREQTDTISDNTKRDKLSNDPIEDVNEERNLILRSIEILMGKCQQYL